MIDSPIHTIKSIIDTHDPVELLEIGAPDDEYDAEIKMIEKRKTELMISEESAREVVREVFEYMFRKGDVSDSKLNQIAVDLHKCFGAFATV